MNLRKFLIYFNLLCLVCLQPIITSSQEVPREAVDGPKYPRESGLPGFEQKARQFQVGPGGDLSYTIPLLTLPGKIPLEIDLTYTSGIKVDQSASWVGLGWSLGEFAVSRATVSGDDATIVSGTTAIVKDQHNDICAHASVKVNDAYQVVIPGKSLKFMNYGDERNPKFAPMNFSADSLYCNPYQIPIYIDSADYPSDQDTFRLITSDGTRYIFGYPLKRTGRDWDNFQDWDCDVSTGETDDGIRPLVNHMWLLTAILSPDYVDGSSPPDSNPLNSANSNRGYWVAMSYSFDNQNEGKKDTAFYGVYGSSSHYDSTEITYPYRIVTPTHVLQFVTGKKIGTNYRCLRTYPCSYGNCDLCSNQIQDKWLKAIRVYKYSGNGSNSTGPLLNEYRFVYASEQLNSSGPAYSDLKQWWEQTIGGEITLLKVFQTGIDSFLVGTHDVTKPPHPYEFSYDYQNPYFLETPEDLGFEMWSEGTTGGNCEENRNPHNWSAPSTWKRDFFGYLDSNSTDTLEQTHWQLTDITTPTGSRITFQWQTDSYKYTDPDYTPDTIEFRNNGGTRIKRIITYPETGTADTIEYEYGENSDGWGYPNSMPPIYFKWKNQFEPCFPLTWHFNPDNVNHMIYYPKITEIYRNKGTIKGKKETYYSTSKTVGIDSLRSHTYRPYDKTCLNTLCNTEGWYVKVLNVYWDRTALMGVLDSVILKDKDGNVISKEKKYYTNVLKFADTASYTDNHIQAWEDNHYILSSSHFIRLDSTLLIKDGVKFVNSYEYDQTYGLPIKGNEHGNGKNRVTTYEYAYNIYPQMKSRHILGEIYRTKVFEEVGQNQSLRAQDSTEWKDFDDQASIERWYPYKSFQWKDANDNQIVETGEQILVRTFNTYDSFGNLVEWTDANSIKSTTKYGMNLEPILQAKNASVNTVFYNDFEHGAAFDGWSIINGALDTIQVFTGNNSVKVTYNGSETKGVSHTVNDPTTYLFSARVKCDVVGRAKIVLKNLSDLTTAQVSNATAGKWELLKISKPLPSGQQLEAYTAVGGGTATAYFDELRLAPDNSLVTNSVYDPLFNTIASSDENGLTKKYIYDGQQRLVIETDETGSPIYGRAYAYSVNKIEGQAGAYHEWAPNGVVEIKATEKGYVDDFSSNSLGNYIQSGAVYDLQKKRIRLPYGSSIKLPFNFSNVALSFDFVKTAPFNPSNPNPCPAGPSNDWECCGNDGNLEVFLHSTSAGDYYKCMLQKNVSGTNKIRLTNSLLYPTGTLSDTNFSITTLGIGGYGPSVMYNFYMIRLGQHIYIFINGHLANYVSDYDPEVLLNFNQIEIASHCDSFYIDNLVVYKNPGVTRYLYDGLGNQFQTLRDDGSATYASETVYDIFNRPVLVTKEKVYSHPDSAFLSSKVSLVNENKTTWELGSPMTSASDVRNYYFNPTNGLPHCDNYPYSYTRLLPDPDGRLIEQSYPGADFSPVSGHINSFVYRTNNASEITGFPSGTLHLTRQKDENGNFVHKYLDQLNNLAAVTVDSGGLNLLTTTSYDILGNPQTVTPPKGSNYNSTFTYNTLSQLISKTAPDNGTTKYVYDLNGNLKHSQDANQQPSGRFTSRIYDAFGRLVVEGVELDVTWTTTPPDINFPYGADADEWKIRRYYDVDYINSGANFVKGQLTKEEANWDGDGTVEYTAKYRYDEGGNLIEQRITIEGLSEKIVKFHYNLQGQLDTIFYPDNTKVPYTYDNLGRLWKIGVGTTADRYATYSYWPGGMVKSVIFKNLYGTPVQTVDYSYNTRDWLDSINNGDIVSPDKFGLALFYQRPSGTSYYNGNISKIVSKMSPLGTGDLFSLEYIYDKANRLTLSNDSATTKYDELLIYDQNGNISYLEIRDTSHAYNYYTNNNRVKDISNWHSANNYKYDNNGNLVRDASKSDTLMNDYRNLTTRVNINGANGTNHLDFYYDAEGNRVKKNHLYYFLDSYACCKCDVPLAGGDPPTKDEGGIIEAAALCNPPCYWATCYRTDSTSEITYYIYYGDNIIAEYDKNGFLTAKYVYAGGERIAKEANELVYFYLKDHLGSTRVVVNEGGLVQAKYNNYAYGDELNSTITTGTDYRYTGKELDEESGFNLYYYGARFYDAKINRKI